jgi:hypothetical protein
MGKKKTKVAKATGEDKKAKPAKPASGGGAGGNKGKVQGKNEKEELKCGESGTYSKLNEKDAETPGMERDHVPSCGALNSQAQTIATNEFSGAELCENQMARLANAASTIAIPKGVHSAFSRTHSSRNTATQMAKDGKNLQAAAKKDLAEIIKRTRTGKPKLTKACRKKYLAWARQVRKRTNKSYNAMIRKAIAKGKTPTPK